MVTMASAVLTLLDSSVPEPSCTVASGGASLPSFMRNRPSSPRTSASSAGLTSLMRPTVAMVSGVWPCATTERDAVAREEDRRVRRHGDRAAVAEHGKPGAGRELAVRVDLQIAGARVGFLPSGPCTAIQPSPLIATSRSRPVDSSAPDWLSQPTVALVA